MIVLEGRQSVLAALQSGRRRVKVVLVKVGAHVEGIDELLALAEKRGVAVKRVAGDEIDAMAHGRSHGGVVADCAALKPMDEAELLALVDQARAAPLLLLLDGTEDDRNLGFTLRSAEALGATAVLLKKHLLDWDETEVSRASSGAFERLPFARIDRESDVLRELKRRGFALVGCVAGAKRAIDDVDLRGPALLAVGGEKRGLSAAVRDECTVFARIPMERATTSLPMSHAAAVLLAEAARQRRALQPEVS